MRALIIIILLVLGAAIAFGVMKLILGSAGEDIGGSFGAGTDGGIYISTDGGASFEQSSQSGETTFARFDILDIVEDPFAHGTWYAATEGSGLYRSPDQGKSWEQIKGQDNVLQKSIVRAISRANAGLLFISVDSGGRGRIWKSTDSGETFREVYSTAKTGVRISTIAQPIQDSSRVLAGLSDGLVISSSDTGETWTAVNQEEPFGADVQKIMFAASNPSMVYALIFSKTPQRSDDGGSTWKGLDKISNEIKGNKEAFRDFQPGQVFAMDVHPGDANRLLLATEGGLLRSVDGGLHYSLLPVPLKPESLPIRSVAFDPSSTGTLFATAGDGLYLSHDSGINWSPTRFTIKPKLAFVKVSAADGNIVFIGTADK